MPVAPTVRTVFLFNRTGLSGSGRCSGSMVVVMSAMNYILCLPSMPW